ncbi:Metallo-peptidase family M12-domain-containing protein [Cristinia sonorae]|uniref:Disintegrin and metalloproteinase domain-containing protein B n=1 Tax=Cristinia sonorae TaxID=1940300 RepID=A0A8K0XQK9_9AGAR|nr:Metallo-peptidase family M12-domain-containing protein [Cristinia sonorae]
MSPYSRIYSLLIALVLGIQARQNEGKDGFAGGDELKLNSYVAASSAPPRPIKRIAHPSTLSLDVLPRRSPPAGNYGRRSFPIDAPILRHTDSFRLKLSAFDDVFHLHLRPNEHLIHPAARINHYRIGPDGKSVLSHTEPLLPDSVKAYWGEVVHANASPERMREDAAGVWPRPSGKSELGWARITVHDAGDSSRAPVFEGAFSVNGDVHHVTTKEQYMRTKHHMDPHIQLINEGDDEELVIWRDSDVMTPHEHQAALGLDNGPMPIVPARTCAHDTLSFNTDPLENQALRRPIEPATSWYDPFGFLDTRFANSSLTRRDDVAGGGLGTNFVDNIGSNAGCPSTQKVVYMGVAADCEYTKQYGSASNASQHIIANFNTASALYKTTFNVSLGIVELEVHDPQCPSAPDSATPWNRACSDTITLNDRLSMFSDWRGKKGDDGAGLWHLMSGCPTGTEVGIAWLATLCQTTASGSPGSVVSGTAVSTSGRVEWQVIAHEIGHNFGAIHDCADGCESNSGQCCPLSAGSCSANSQFIMSPVAQTSEMKFSPCTLGNICSLMTGNSGGKTNTGCLIDASNARKTISLQMCGNGIVEEGEECDPGSGAESSCCDATTCKLRAGAVCDPQSSPCCTEQCGFAPTTQVCRPSKDNSCDTAEMCTGNSSSCPTDIFSPNGQSCGSGGLSCANGVCTSLDKQCQIVGASMNLKKACPNQNDKSCQVSCQDPSVANQCIILQSALVDGSPCGYGGTCVSGNCQTGSFLDTAKSWYTKNLQISIPVTVVVGIIVILILWGLLRAMHRCAIGSGRKERKSMRRLSSWGNAPPMVQIPPTPGPTAYPRPGPNVPPPSTYPRNSRHGTSNSWDRQQRQPPSLTPGYAGHRPSRSTGSAYEGQGQGHYAPQFNMPAPSHSPPQQRPY